MFIFSQVCENTLVGFCELTVHNRLERIIIILLLWKITVPLGKIGHDACVEFTNYMTVIFTLHKLHFFLNCWL